MREHDYPTTAIRAVGVISLSAVSGDSIPIDDKILGRSCPSKEQRAERPNVAFYRGFALAGLRLRLVGGKTRVRWIIISATPVRFNGKYDRAGISARA
jgi:hypothetical protein